MNIPYVYLIGWTKLDKWYIGSRTAVGCHPSDLWKTYFTSSEYVKDFREANGEPDSFEILKKFEEPKEALAFEEEKQREFDVINNDKFLNKNIGGKDFYCIGAWIGKKHSEETKEKIKNALLGRKDSLETRLKKSLSRIGEKNPRWGKPSPMLGKKQSEKFKKRMSEVHKGKSVSEETRKKMSKIAKNRIFSEETRKKMSDKRKGQKLSEEHRQKLIGENNPFYGKTHSEETKRKMKESWAKRKALKEKSLLCV